MSASVTRAGFTTEVRDWAAWIAPVDLDTASADQLAVLDESGAHAKTSQYPRALRNTGFSDEDIADLANSVAMFAWANRRMPTLGEPVDLEETK